MRDKFNRASGARGGIFRGSFNNAAGHPSLSISGMAKIMRSADAVRKQVDRHHAANRLKWTTSRYGELLRKSANTLSLKPTYAADDPKGLLLAKAQAGVSSKHAQRMAKVDRAERNMLQSGKVRATRKVNWGVGLGD